MPLMRLEGGRRGLLRSHGQSLPILEEAESEAAVAFEKERHQAEMMWTLLGEACPALGCSHSAQTWISLMTPLVVLVIETR